MWKEVISTIARIISDKGGDEFVRNSAERSTWKEQYPQRRKRTDEEFKGATKIHIVQRLYAADAPIQ